MHCLSLDLIVAFVVRDEETEIILRVLYALDLIIVVDEVAKKPPQSDLYSSSRSGDIQTYPSFLRLVENLGS